MTQKVIIEVGRRKKKALNLIIKWELTDGHKNRPQSCRRGTSEKTRYTFLSKYTIDTIQSMFVTWFEKINKICVNTVNSILVCGTGISKIKTSLSERLIIHMIHKHFKVHLNFQSEIYFMKYKTFLCDNNI